MKKHILSDPEKDCTGCSACKVVCPKEAIQIEQNSEGFYEAFVNEQKCVNCGICQGVCIKYIQIDHSCRQLVDCPVAGCISINKEVQQKTTSGGIAYEISKWGIEHGYKIMGVIYDYASHRAKTILSSTINDLDKLSGSKYLQSDCEEAISSWLKEAKSNPNNKYICIGTPCQIYGIKRLIQKKCLQNECILIDLFCHGVPSYFIWPAYLKKIQDKSSIGKVESIQFRYKGNGWHQYTMRMEGDRKWYTKIAYSDLFYRFFFDNVILNKACFSCEVRKTYTVADIRLGDFWGKAYEHREDGVSAVLISTNKGKQLMEMLSEEKSVQTDRYWTADVCLAAQSTDNYPNLELRNKTISLLREGVPIEKILHYYFGKLSLTYKLRSILKRCVLILPLPFLIKLRRMVRRII